jgi:SPX domain protein involved in polyphosphate accumulation
MMDYERTEKELQQIFEEIQHSYKTLADNVFTLQEQTLELARTLFESSAEKTPGTQATLEEMANQSRIQREEFEKLIRKSREAYTKMLNAPTDEHHYKVEEAKADLEEASPS